MALKYVEMTFLGVKCKALPYKRNVEHHHDHGRNYITLLKNCEPLVYSGSNIYISTVSR